MPYTWPTTSVGTWCWSQMSILQLCNESRNHLFFDCSYSGLVWRLISDRCQLQLTSSWEDVIQQMHASPRNKDLRRLTLLAVQGTIYWLWHERNTRLHEQTFRTAEAIFSTLDKQLRNRVQSFRHTNPRASTAVMQLWFLRSSFPSSVPFPHRRYPHGPFHWSWSEKFHWYVF